MPGGTTAKHGFPWPDPAGANNYPLHLENALNTIDPLVVTMRADTFANRGAASGKNELFVATDTGAMYIDLAGTGPAWVQIASGGGLASYLALAGGTMVGDITMGAHNLLQPRIVGYREPALLESVSGTVVLDFSQYALWQLTLTGAITLSPTNVPSSGDSVGFLASVIQGGAGSYGITWMAGAKFPGGVAPVLSTAVGKKDIVFGFTVDGGVTWNCQLVMQDVR